tara:strand:+ start:1063 stop:1974 length:912 start_codon:yes stop_codon:yes gene_type:complete
MGVAKALGKAAVDLGQQTLKRFAKQGYTKELAPQVIKSMSDHINITKGVDIPDIETMLKGTAAGEEAATESLNDFSKTLLTSEHYQGNVNKMTRQFKYEPFKVDETLPIEEQKRIYKQSASDFIYDAEQAEGKTVPVSRFFKEKGKLRTPDEGELDLKWKTKKDGKKDFQPKLKKTTAKETTKRKGRETPWVTQKDEIKNILAEVGEEAKLAKLLKLIRTQYNAKKKGIRASGLSKGHQKALHNGGLDVPENIVGEQGVSTKEVRGNYSRQYKDDPSDAELTKQGAFVGTLKEYILMKLKEVE